MPDVQSIATPLHVLVVGGGLGGAAAAVALRLAGCQVTMLESASKLSEIGAGVQMSPNVTCLLRRWGLGDALQSSSVVPQDCNFRRWQNGEVISRTLLNPKMQEDFGSPYWVLHRAHLLECLHNRATELGAITHLNSRVATVDLKSCTVTTKDSVCYSADVIVGCDGIKSTIRPYLLSHPDPGPRKTDFACYRATVPMENLRSLSATTSIVQQPDLNIWIGEGRHVMTYPIAGGKTFNLVLSHPYDSSKSNSLAPTAAEVEAEMLQNYKGWDPVLQQILEQIRNPTKWELMDYATDMDWVHHTAPVVMMGDAVHGMLPYMSQGAAQAIEDAAVLAKCLNGLTAADDIHASLKLYESIRKPRAVEVQNRSSLNGRIWHYPDGPDQEARDRGMKASISNSQYLRSTNQWSDPAVQLWLYAHDAEAHAEEVLQGIKAASGVTKLGISIKRKGGQNGSKNSGIEEMLHCGLLARSMAY